MTKNRYVLKTLIVGLVLAMQNLHLPVLANSETATLTGSILLAKNEVPLSGARLHVGNPRNGRIYSSQPTGTDGDFIVDDLPEATYELAVESDDGLYVINSPVQVVRGETRSLRIAVDNQTGPAAKKKAKPAKKPGPWSNPVTGTLLVVGSAMVVGLVVTASGGGSDTQASPFSN